MNDNLDHLGGQMPTGYRRWSCDVCGAVCNYEAMTQCVRRSEPAAVCGFDRDRPASNAGAFGFMIPAPAKAEGK